MVDHCQILVRAITWWFIYKQIWNGDCLSLGWVSVYLSFYALWLSVVYVPMCLCLWIITKTAQPQHTTNTKHAHERKKHNREEKQGRRTCLRFKAPFRFELERNCWQSCVHGQQLVFYWSESGFERWGLQLQLKLIKMLSTSWNMPFFFYLNKCK